MKILSACCGQRSYWFNKQQKDTTFIDIRPEVKPDVVMDCTKTVFEDKTFDLIEFDPPHESHTKAAKGVFVEKYGAFTAAEIRNLVAAAFKEFHRILKDEGFVIFKWNTHCQQLKTILPLIDGFEFLFGQKTAFRTKHASSTYWFCLKKGVKFEKSLRTF